MFLKETNSHKSIQRSIKHVLNFFLRKIYLTKRFKYINKQSYTIRNVNEVKLFGKISKCIYK